MKATSLVQALLGEDPVHPGEAELEGQRHGVGEDQRRRAGAALAAVDGHEVDAAPGLPHEVGELVPELAVADRGLDSHRQTGFGGEQLHPVEQAVGVGELGMPRRADAVAPLRNAACGRDLGGHLGAGQQPAEARLGALAELDLQRPHRGACDHVLELVQVEAAFGVAAAEVRGADLEDQLAAVPVVAARCRLRRCCAGSRPVRRRG